MSPKVQAARILDVALSTKGQLFHSYPNHELKWLMRKDLLSLIRSFPSLSLSATTTSSPIYLGLVRDKATLPLLEASGILCASTPIRLTIILHSFHPIVPPLVIITSPVPTSIPASHPFLHPLTGAATTPYLLTWQHPKSNLPDLVSNLVKIFHFWPINFPKPQHSIFEKRSSASRREAVDRLSMLLLSDLAAYNSALTEELDAFGSIKSTLSRRAVVLTEAVRDLEGEEMELKTKVKEVNGAASALSEWLSDHRLNLKIFDEDMDMEAFEVVDNEFELHASEKAIDEAMEVADEALKREAIGLVDYLREIRAMAKDQFHHLKVASTW